MLSDVERSFDLEGYNAEGGAAVFYLVVVLSHIDAMGGGVSFDIITRPDGGFEVIVTAEIR